MMKPTSTPHSKGPAKARRKTREETNQEAHDHKRQKKHRGHTVGGCASDNGGASGGGNQDKQGGPRIDSEAPTPLGVTEKVTKQYKPRNEKPILSPQAELDLLETDKHLDALLEHFEAGETLGTEDQSWINTGLDRIDELIQKLGLSHDDEEEEGEEERQEDVVRLLRGGN